MLRHTQTNRNTTICGQEIIYHRDGSIDVGNMGLPSFLRHSHEMNTRNRSNSYRGDGKCAINHFRQFTKQRNWNKNQVLQAPVESIDLFHQDLIQQGYAVETARTYAHHIGTAMGVSLAGLFRHGTVLERRRSTGKNPRAIRAAAKPKNQRVVKLAKAVGLRRGALQKLTGKCYAKDESGRKCILCIKDKGGKTQLQRIMPGDEEWIYREYFQSLGPDDPVFPEKIDGDLDIQRFRMEAGVEAYKYYEVLVQDPKTAQMLRKELMRRFTNPLYGNKRYLLLKKTNPRRAKVVLKQFRDKVYNDKPYILRGNNKKAAEQFGRPLKYNRLALMCVSVFHLSHWRLSVTISNYILWE